MYYIIYLSAGVNWFNEDELKDILAISRVNNSRDNVTGLLLYNKGNFIQLLEGEEEDVQHTFERISTDQRHKGITPIASGFLEHRNFPEWAMGFKSINTDTLNELDGYFDPANNDLNTPERHISTKLLNAFVKTAKRD